MESAISWRLVLKNDIPATKSDLMTEIQNTDYEKKTIYYKTKSCDCPRNNQQISYGWIKLHNGRARSIQLDTCRRHKSSVFKSPSKSTTYKTLKRSNDELHIRKMDLSCPKNILGFCLQPYQSKYELSTLLRYFVLDSEIYRSNVPHIKPLAVLYVVKALFYPARSTKPTYTLFRFTTNIIGDCPSPKLHKALIILQVKPLEEVNRIILHAGCELYFLPQLNQ